MIIKIKRIDKSLPLPDYKTEGAVAFDFIVRETTTIKSYSTNFIPLNVCIAIPKGFVILMAARSSLHKKGLMLANGVAVMDQDYSGNNDEYKSVVYNFTKSDVVIERGDRIVQGLILPIEKCDWNEVSDMGTKDRGGFGSTG